MFTFKMAYHNDWLLQSASVFWIFTLLLSESQSKKTQIYYTEPTDCGDRKILGSAVVYSHSQHDSGGKYPHDLVCPITFKAENDNWRLMLRMIYFDIPDRTVKGNCNDALYVYDSETHLAVAMADAGGVGGLCGSILPPTLKSTGQYMTVVFQSTEDIYHRYRVHIYLNSTTSASFDVSRKDVKYRYRVSNFGKVILTSITIWSWRLCIAVDSYVI